MTVLTAMYSSPDFSPWMEQLACNCSFSRCHEIVNMNAEEQVGTIYTPCLDLIDWIPDDD